MLVLALGMGLFAYGDSYGVRNSGSWISLIGIMLYLAFFSIGLGNAPWTVNSEIYPLHLRGVGISLSTTTNWLSNYFVSQVFLTLISTDLGKVVTFACISLFSVLAFIFVYFLLPETKGKPIE